MKFVRKMQPYMRKPFMAGGTGPAGYDCMGLVYAYCRDNDAPIPDEFHGITVNDYAELYQADKETAKTELTAYYQTIGEDVNIAEILAGDLLLMTTRDGSLFPAVYCGNGKYITSYIDVGVRVFEITNDVRPVAARRVVR
jgi:cell wall-associated NlpC family hydrolase